jgi:hypothetical protein
MSLDAATLTGRPTSTTGNKAVVSDRVGEFSDDFQENLKRLSHAEVGAVCRFIVVPTCLSRSRNNRSALD